MIIWGRITSFLLLRELFFLFEKQSARTSQSLQASLPVAPHSPPLGCRAGLVLAYHTETGPQLYLLICLLLPPEGGRWQRHNYQTRPPRMCDSPSPRHVCLMLMTKDLTPDLSAPDESMKDGASPHHVAVTAQQRVTIKGCHKTLFCLSEPCVPSSVGGSTPVPVMMFNRSALSGFIVWGQFIRSSSWSLTAEA